MIKAILNTLFSIIIIALLSSSDLLAQGNGRGRGNGNGTPGNSNSAPGRNQPAGVPIDGGAGILLAAGAAYGLKKIRDYRKSRNNP